ncbi:MAG: hypothetical protein ABS920_14765 [Sporosarcina sp.]
MANNYDERAAKNEEIGTDLRDMRNMNNAYIRKWNAKTSGLQTQLNEIVADGDSSVEAAQARVDSENNSFATLKERLDTKEDSFTAQLAQRPTKAEARLKTEKLELEDMSETTLGAMSGNATFNLLSIPQDRSVTPQKTDFVTYSNYNALDNSTYLASTKWVRDWQTSTLKRLDGADMFTFAPIYLKQGQTAYTTNIRTNASFIVDGTWDEATQVYSGSWQTVQTFLTAAEWQECEIVADKDYILFVTCSVAYATPEDTMVVIGDGLPDQFVPYMQGELTIPELIIKPKNLIVNPKEKGCFQTINAAIKAAVDGDTIIVYPGVYIEHVRVLDKKINIVGIDKETCILKMQTGSYLEAPLEIAKGTVSNMTIYSERPVGLTPPEKTSYGVHIDWLESVGETLTFNNCILKSDFNAGAGIGLRKDFVLTFKDCEFITTEPTNTNGACFFHDSNNSTAYGRGDIIFDNCRMKSASSIAIMPASSGITTNGNSVYMTFYNTIIWSDINGKTNGAVGVGRPVQGDGWRLYNNFYLTSDSFGNNNTLFNVA